MDGAPYLPTWRHVLVVTAHPDDECMFFAPAIQALRAYNVSISALCLSQGTCVAHTGNAEGLGDVRRSELLESYGVLDVPRENVTCLNDPCVSIPDKDIYRMEWTPSGIRSISLKKSWTTSPGMNQMRYAGPTHQILTFDPYGISGHANHKAAYYGALHARTRTVQPPALLSLRSRNVFTKFGGLPAALVDRTVPQRGLQILAPPTAYFRALTAMKKHQTQLVWFRYLYVTFSTYMHINAISINNA